MKTEVYGQLLSVAALINNTNDVLSTTSIGYGRVSTFKTSIVQCIKEQCLPHWISVPEISYSLISPEMFYFVSHILYCRRYCPYPIVSVTMKSRIFMSSS